MTYQSKSASQPDRKLGRGHARQARKEDKQVYLITGASESVVADSERKNRIYAALIGVRIASLFVVLVTDGWVQLAVFVGGMLAPWIGVQVANTIRQVQARSIETVQPQQAALEAARGEAEEDDNDTVIVGDVLDDQPAAQTAKPSAESSATEAQFGQNERDDDDKRS
ncbi:hypothetical protein GCM10023190_03890 [Enteractinococcus fodinae]|uniref:Membrane protein YccC n=1 Tax=Enteractinococcus fodinae TaxID=684663 RepID=A0ABU2B2W3_9MICC|nr:DUF3099 domain-containing protein [Enteractinococcus fodinae]MDR7347133.1 putative membrane protein YccC [Enteractinococcus fodinae]